MNPRDASPPLRRAHLLLLLLAFGLAHALWPIYTQNQLTYFVHGLAGAGVGLLGEDWFAGTADPMPAFSLLVGVTARLLDENLFYVYQLLLLGLYAWSLLGIIAASDERFRSPQGTLLGLALIIAVHSKVFDDLKPLWEGMAGQYVQGGYLQPSVFGVFLILSIRCFAVRRSIWAAFWLGVAATFHPTYLLSAALLTLAYMQVAFRSEGGARRALSIAAVATASVAPIAIYVFLQFAPTAETVRQAAQAILVHGRIPHHAEPFYWFDAESALQLGVMVAALPLTRGSRLFPVMLIPLVGSCALTLVQLVSGSEEIALLFPWRISSFLVPISSLLLLSRALQICVTWLRGRGLRVDRPLLYVAVILVFVLTSEGVRSSVRRALKEASRGERTSFEFVEQHRRSGDVYLIPPSWMRFRLATGAPIVVDYKSHPYRDDEVVEWRRRLDAAERFYAASGRAACGVLAELVGRYGVTHVVEVRPRGSTVCTGLEVVHRDGNRVVQRFVSH